ncbi:MAG: amidase [Rhodospirillaceae bacterium]|jgi:amidase|nr:amidase [Rhodospirillaceae bacterium]MBT7759038.1 amidase [Rhodospirillaceae bacterium]MBT7978675.1 amidase [Rhodospirillaceae bacterium]
MAVQLPTPEQILDLADDMGLDLTDADVQSYIDLFRGNVDAYNVVDAMPDNLPQVHYPRTPGYRPRAEENPYNAWYIKTEVKGASRGKLKGKTVVLKDNVMLAGVPMMNGAATLEGYVPEIDATVATRLLDAGATIVGKSHCENFCLSGGSHTNATGPVHNPHKMGYSAGGSSSGSAALLAAGEVDMAIGGDQGGSIRMPASFCGVYGMKATHGLVPYTGVMPIEVYVDHIGPMTNSVADNALMLEVLAGDDGYDPRQYNVKTQRYTQALQGKKGIKGMKIAIIKEGFMQENAESDVNTKVRAAAKKLQSMGAKVKEVSIPMHMLGAALWMPIGVEGLTQTMMYGDGYGVSRPDLYVTSLMDFHRNWRNRANEMSETTKLFTMFGTYIRKYYGSRYYGKAMNITRLLTAAYDAVLDDYDLLLMPTTPIKATPLPAPDASREEYVQRALEMISNTAPFDISHHPAMAIPCGMSKGLPVSMMLVGKHFNESSIYQAAHAFEQGTNWKRM